MLSQDQLPDALHIKRLKRLDTLLLTLSVDVEAPKNVKTIKELARGAGCTEIQKWNISDILRSSKGLAIRLKEGWCLTTKGRNYVNDLDVVPSSKTPKIINHTKQLRSLASRISDQNTQNFINEAISAYEFGLYRSAVVLSWAGAISLLYDQIIKNKLVDFNSEAKRRDNKWRPAKIKDDLSRMKESDFLDIIGCPPLSIIGKDIKEELKNNCLRLRNSCGHPNSLQIGENKVSAHLEVLILNIFSKFS